jgi:Cu-Zn family superoxide dismutase
MHIHEGRSCTGNAADPFADTGGHFNPKNQPHPLHAGDLPPLFSNGGFGYYSFFTARFRPAEIIGRTVVIHSGPDDFKTQPAGDSGSKIACGVVEKT